MTQRPGFVAWDVNIVNALHRTPCLGSLWLCFIIASFATNISTCQSPDVEVLRGNTAPLLDEVIRGSSLSGRAGLGPGKQHIGCLGRGEMDRDFFRIAEV